MWGRRFVLISPRDLIVVSDANATIGPGKMTDWRDIVEMVESFSNVFHHRHSNSPGPGSAKTPSIPKALNPPISTSKASDAIRPIAVHIARAEERNGYTGSHALDVDVEQELAAQGSGASSTDSEGYWDRFWR